jgi:dipeptidase D
MKSSMHHFFFLSLFSIASIPASASQRAALKLRTQQQHIIEHLEPRLLWDKFYEISQIPHGSGDEAELARKIMDEAATNNLMAVQDSVGNVIVTKPASSAEYKDAPKVVIQCHMDMVCEKNKTSEHDFTKDPIKFVRKDNFLYADGTTLGADNGIGVATSLAIMNSKDITHGPLEFLFTTHEEDGFDGAKNITPKSVDGRMLLNIDTEEIHKLYVGCAGSSNVHGTIAVQREQLSDDFAYASITLDGLYGGHSGVDIDKPRASSLKIASRLLQELGLVNYRLVSVDGGNKLNAIARDAEIIMAIPYSDVSLYKRIFTDLKNRLLNEYKSTEPTMTITSKWIEDKKLQVMDEDTQRKVVTLMDRMPHGVIKMSSTLQGIVETSTNFSRISTSPDSVKVSTMQRSMVGSELDKLAHEVAHLVKSIGAQAEYNPQANSPEWEPNEHSKVLNAAKKTHMRLFGKEAEILAIHAGLECGAFFKQIPGLDTISFGPTIIDAHTPSEHVDIESVPPFWNFLTALLGDIAQNGKHVSEEQAGQEKIGLNKA